MTKMVQLVGIRFDNQPSNKTYWFKNGHHPQIKQGDIVVVRNQNGEDEHVRVVDTDTVPNPIARRAAKKLVRGISPTRTMAARERNVREMKKLPDI